MIKCVNCGIEVRTLYHIYNETNYCLSTCENCGQICDKYVEWEIPLIIIDLFLFKTQVYRHLIYNHSQFPSISPVTVLGQTDRVVPGTEDSSSTVVSSNEETSNTTGTTTVGASTVTKGKGANSTLMECTSEKNPNEIAAVTNSRESSTFSESGTNTKEAPFGAGTKGVTATKESPFGVGGWHWTRHRNGKIIRIILLLISATILDSYSMLTSCNYLTNTPNICFPQFQSYNQTLLNYIILYFKSFNTYINSQDEIMDMIEKMSSIMLYYSRLNIFKRVGMNAEYCKRIYNRTMEFFFLIFLQNPTLSNRNFINKFDCKNITEIGIITLSILRVLSYNIFIIFSVTVLGQTASNGPGTPTPNGTEDSSNNTTKGTTGTIGASTVTEGKGANFTAMECTSGKGANFTAMECTMGKGANFTAMECTMGKGANSMGTKCTMGKGANFMGTKCTMGKGANFTAMECTPGKGANSMGTKCTTKDTKGVGVGTEEAPFGGVGMTKHRNGGLIGILNIFYAILLSFHIKSLVLMINVWYPTDTILIVIELYIYLNHIIELKIICNISLFSSIFIIIFGAIIKIFIYFLWFHIINKFQFITFLSIK